MGRPVYVWPGVESPDFSNGKAHSVESSFTSWELKLLNKEIRTTGMQQKGHVAETGHEGTLVSRSDDIYKYKAPLIKQMFGQCLRRR